MTQPRKKRNRKGKYMKREFFKSLNIEALTDDVIAQIMDEAGKDIESHKKQLEGWKTKYDDVESKLKKFDGVNIEDYQKQIKALTDEMNAKQAAWETERTTNSRKAEINEFLSGFNFINDRTKKSYADDLYAAREDKANEGKNYKDIFDTLIKGADGKELPNICAQIGCNRK